MFVLQQTHALYVGGKGAVCVGKGLVEYYTSRVCVCLSITCSAALTPISQWSVFNLNHIATSSHRPAH